MELAEMELTDNRANKFEANILGSSASISVSLRSYLSLEVPKTRTTNFVLF